MIFIHELGHFISARASGVGVKEFAIGMGPKIYSKVSDKSGIRYSLRALPIGGYVSMVGEDEESDAPNAFGRAKIFKRMLIIVSGALMNILLGFLIMLTVIISSEGNLAANVVGKFDECALSEQSGLRVGDRIIKVDGSSVHTAFDLRYAIFDRGNKAIDLLVIRDGEKVLLESVIFPTEYEAGTTFGIPDFKVFGEEKSFGNVLKYTYFNSLGTVRMVWDMMLDLITGRYSMEAVSGPIGITGEIVATAKRGPGDLLLLCAVITINLGVVNLMPLPALDGGRLVFLLIEAVRGKPVNRNIEGYIHFIGILLLFALMIIVALKDIWGFFT